MGLSLKLQLVIDSVLVGLGASIGNAVSSGLLGTAVGSVAGVFVSTLLQYFEGTTLTAKVGA
jgi:hypothetical protein